MSEWISAKYRLPNCNREYEILYGKEDEHGRCSGCKDCKTVNCNGGYKFFGCYHNPYHGKWVAEIKECPKDEQNK